MGRWHAHAAVRAGARVSAVVDPDRARAARLAGRHRGCRTFADLTGALEAADVVHICTPTASHVSLTEQALCAGRHVLVEKPLASSAADTAHMLRLAEAQGALLCPVHQFLFQRGVETALARMADIGSLRHVDVAICSAGAQGAEAALRDQIAVEILPHPLSVLVRLLRGPVDELDWSIRRSGAGEFRALAQDGDVTVAMLVSMGGRPTVNRLRLVGTGGAMHLDLFHGFCVVENGTVSRARKVTQPYTHAAMLVAAATANLVRRSLNGERAYPGLLTLVRRFYQAAAGLGRSPIAPAQTLAVARAYDRLCILLLPPR